MSKDSHFEENNPGRPILGPISDLPVPMELYALADTLPALEIEALEVQLQKFDLFLVRANSLQRKAISEMLFRASSKAILSKIRLRLIKAAKGVANGGNTKVS